MAQSHRARGWGGHGVSCRKQSPQGKVGRGGGSERVTEAGEKEAAGRKGPIFLEAPWLPGCHQNLSSLLPP